MNIIKNIDDLNNKKILLRCDFDVPVFEGKIDEEFRIKKQVPTIDYLAKQSTVVMLAHIKAVDSFEPVLPQLEKIIGKKIKLLKKIDELQRLDESRNLYLLDNTRNWSGEEKNDKEFAKLLAAGFDLYVNNAFAVCHRSHASVSAIAEFLPSYSGFLVEEETTQLDKMISLPADNKIFIMGGAKASTKVPVIKYFINKSERILVGGVVANDILKERGVDIGSSIADEDSASLLEGLDVKDSKLIVPMDFNIFENKILDIGPKTIEEYKGMIKAAKVVIWNGPMGLFEDKRFLLGTESVAKAIADSGAFKTIGGGDTISAIDKLGLLDKFDFVSTGGGSMLAFLSGEKLPGLEALGYYSK